MKLGWMWICVGKHAFNYLLYPKSEKTMDSFDMSPECGTDISEEWRCSVYATKIVLQFVLFGFS
jgi:hypothetical protein